MKPPVYEGVIRQGGIEVAGVSAPDLESLKRELAHYALVYGQDGPVEIRLIGRAKRESESK